MKWLYVIGGVSLIVIVILSLLRIRVKLVYRREGKDDRFTFHVSTLAGLVRFQRTFSVLEFDLNEFDVRVEETTTHSFSKKQSKKKQRITADRIKSRRQRWQSVKSNIVGLYRIMVVFLSKVHCQRLTWHSTIGTGDAAEAGILTGLLWSLKSVTLGWSTQFVKMEVSPDLQVTPDYNRPRLETHFTCILNFRLGHAIFTGLRILMHVKYRFKKNLKQSQRVADQSG